MYFILSIGNDPETLARTSNVLAEAGYAIISITDLRKAAERIANHNEDFDLVVLCGSLDDEDRLQLKNMTRRHRPFTPVVVLPGNPRLDDHQLILDAVGEAFSGAAGSQIA